MNDQKHALVSPLFLDPFLLNKIRGTSLEGSAIDQQTIEVEGQRFCLAHPEEITLSPGQRIIVSWHGTFYLQTESERLAREQELAKQRREWEEQHAREKEARRAFLNRQRTEAEAFNASLRVPVQWKPGYKSVISGLTETSWGDGCNRTTVEHIWLQEDLNEGRLHRKAGDLLCSTSSSANGKQWVSPESTARDGNGDVYAPRITCQSCLKIAQRWRRE